MKTIYVFGNPLVREDSLPLNLLDKLRKEFPSIEFREFDTVEDLNLDGELNIIDTVVGIKRVELIEDVDRVVMDKIFTVHDFDLGYNLRLWKKMKMLGRVRIFGIPLGMEESEALGQLKGIFRSMNSIRVIEEFLGLPRFSDGRIDYTKSDRAPTVDVFVSYNGKILIVKRSKKLKNYPGKWSIITGYLDELRPLEEKVLDELREETGIDRDIISSIHSGKRFDLKDKKKTWLVFPFLVALKKEPDIRLDFENTDFRWIRPQDLSKFDTVPKTEEVFERVRRFV